jgi:hypothetical protein
MRAALLIALVLCGCLGAPAPKDPHVVYDETLSFASAGETRSESFDVTKGYTSLEVGVSGRNAQGTAANVKIELLDPEGEPTGGMCMCGGGSAGPPSSFGSGGRPQGADGTWSLSMRAEGKTAIHVTVSAT